MKILTKGDNNSVDDRGLYAPGQLWLQKKDIVGRARGFVPYVGIVTILMNDYPKFKVIKLFWWLTDDNRDSLAVRSIRLFGHIRAGASRVVAQSS